MYHRKQDKVKNLLIVPTRSRPHKVKEFYDSFIEHTGNTTQLCFAIDDDDESMINHNFDDYENVIWEINPRLRISGTLNLVANKYIDDYDYVSFMGDDHRIRTTDWDLELTSDPIKYLIAYGNDLLQGQHLPTSVLMDSNIIKNIGYMCPPTIKHLYLDNFWKVLGQRLGTLKYYDEVIIEHMHYSINKSQADDLYIEVNSHEIANHDKAAYDYYVHNQFNLDLEKLI